MLAVVTIFWDLLNKKMELGFLIGIFKLKRTNLTKKIYVK